LVDLGHEEMVRLGQKLATAQEMRPEIWGSSLLAEWTGLDSSRLGR